MSVILTDAWPVYQYASARADEYFWKYMKSDRGSLEAENLYARSQALRELAIDILDEKHLS